MDDPTNDFELSEPSTIFDFSKFSKIILDNSINIIGFPFDGMASYRKGAQEAPNAIRKAVSQIESYSPYLDCDLEAVHLIDLGNVPVNHDITDVDQQFDFACMNFFEIINGIEGLGEEKKFLTIGGDHSTSYAPITSMLNKFPNLHLLQLDAHADLRDGYLGHKFSHASVMRRCLDNFSEYHRLIQYGIRSGTLEEFEYMKKNNTLFSNLDSLLNRLTNLSDDIPIYLTLDLDFFDPAFLPGTGTPEAGGENFQTFVEIIQVLSKKMFVGADIVELAVGVDATGNSELFAAKVAREVLLALS